MNVPKFGDTGQSCKGVPYKGAHVPHHGGRCRDAAEGCAAPCRIDSEAHEISPTSWALNCRSRESYIRLNIARLAAITLRPDNLSALLDTTIDFESISGLPISTSFDDYQSKTYLDSTWCQGKLSDVVAHWDTFRKSHLAAVRTAAQQMKSGWQPGGNPCEMCVTLKLRRSIKPAG